MNHLDELTLNEYLDATLDESARAEAESHLQTCASCNAKLDELKMLFTELEELPGVQVQHDLTASILNRLPRPEPVRTWVWTRAFAAQLGVAIGFVFWLGMQFNPQISIPQVTFPHLPTFDYRIFIARLLSFQFSISKFQISLSDLEFQIPTLPLPDLGIQLPTFNPSTLLRENLQPSTTLLGILILSAVFLWVVGNVVLLKSRQEVQK